MAGISTFCEHASGLIPVIGTYTVNENLNGVQNQGQFDLRMLAVKNLRAEPDQFTPATDSPTTTIRADILALPASTALYGNGWQPTGPIAWRLGVVDPILVPPAAIKWFSGESAVTPDASVPGKVGTIEQAWDGTDDGGDRTHKGRYILAAQALGPVGGGNALTRGKAAEVTIGPRTLKVEPDPATPTSFDPSGEDPATLAFDIVTDGFDDPQVNWQVKVVQEPDGAHSIFRDFGSGTPWIPGPLYQVTPSADGKSFHVELEWDGSNDAGQTIDTEFSWEIEAHACDGVAPAAVTLRGGHLPVDLSLRHRLRLQ